MNIFFIFIKSKKQSHILLLLMIKKDFNSDYEMAEGLQKGEMEAFNAIFKKYSARLYGFLIKHLKSEVETEGLVQNVFLKVWENRKNIKKEHSLKPICLPLLIMKWFIFLKRRNYFLISVKSMPYLFALNMSWTSRLSINLFLKKWINSLNYFLINKGRYL